MSLRVFQNTDFGSSAKNVQESMVKQTAEDRKQEDHLESITEA